MKYKIFTISAIAAVMIGCGGGSSDSSSTTYTTNTGVFVDAPVAGLVYETSSGIKGVTDVNGTFSYQTGDSVIFKLGNALIGTVDAKSKVTPIDVDPESFDKIAYVLQNLDTDGNISNGIQLPNDDVLKSYTGVSKVTDINVSDLKTKLKSVLNVNFPDISLTSAKENLYNYLASQTNDSLIKDVLANGLLGLKDKKLYFAYLEDLHADGPAIVTFSDNNITYDLNGETDVENVTSFSSSEIIRSDGSAIKFLNVDIDKNVVLMSDNDGIYVCSDSEEYVNNYKNEYNDKYPKSAVDASSLKGVNLFGLDDNNYNWYSIVLNNDDISLYNVDDIFSDSLTSSDNLYYNNKYDVKYDGSNVLEFYDDNEWKKVEVYKYPLTNQNVNTMILGAVFDSINPVMSLFSKFGINSVKFTKGNAYCSLLWDECWIDEDALREIDSTFNNINYQYALMKGEAKTPRYTKFSDYLKQQTYYSVYTEDNYLDYESDSWDENEGFCYNELESNTDHTDQDCIGNVDSAIKVLAEYDNGVLVEFSHDGIHYKSFLYNNVEDAKKVFDTLLPLYQ